MIAVCFRIASSEEGRNIERRYERLIKIFSNKENDLFVEWAETVPNTVDVGLNRNILARGKDSALMLNFDPELLAVLQEVNYLKQMSHSDIPDEALKVLYASRILDVFYLSIILRKSTDSINE